MRRLRLKVVHWPRRALAVVDTPRPDCPLCDGRGGHAWDYGHPETGEYEGSDFEPCTCWNDLLRWTLLPLPRLPLRWRRDRHLYSDEPPF